MRKLARKNINGADMGYESLGQATGGLERRLTAEQRLLRTMVEPHQLRRNARRVAFSASIED